MHLYKLKTFAYSRLMKFPNNKYEIKAIITNNFYNNDFDLFLCVMLL